MLMNIKIWGSMKVEMGNKWGQLKLWYQLLVDKATRIKLKEN